MPIGQRFPNFGATQIWAWWTSRD